MDHLSELRISSSEATPLSSWYHPRSARCPGDQHDDQPRSAHQHVHSCRSYTISTVKYLRTVASAPYSYVSGYVLLSGLVPKIARYFRHTSGEEVVLSDDRLPMPLMNYGGGPGDIPPPERPVCSLLGDAHRIRKQTANNRYDTNFDKNYIA